jgi:phosphate-selective porin OprO and OprP
VVNPLGDFSYAETDVDFTQSPLLSVGTSYFMNKVAYGASADALTGSNYQKNFLKPLTGLPGNDGSTPPVALAQDTAQVGMFEVDAAFKWMGIYAQGEYFMAGAEAKKTVNAANYAGPLGDGGGKRKLKSSGYYVQAGYTVLPKTLEIAARYSAYDPNTTSWESATDTSAKHDKRTEISGAVNYYLYKHGLKLQAELSSQGREERSLAAGALPSDYKKLNNLIGRVQAQVIF